MPLTDQPLALLARPTLAGEPLDPASLAGKVVMINFWSPSCGYCVQELPDLQAVANQLGEDKIELVTVMVNGKPERASQVAARVGLDAPIIVADGELSRQFQVTAVPWTVLVGKDGRAKRVLRGAHGADVFRRAAEKLL